MLTKFRRLAALSAVILTTVTSPLHAQNTTLGANLQTPEENAEERINFSGKLRMLSQRIPSAACHLVRGVDVEGASALLNSAPAEFEKILTALEFGDPDLNIQEPETRRKTLARIHELRARWEPMKAAADAVANGTATDADIDYILTNNMNVLGAAIPLVSELVKQYSNPNAVSHANLMLIDISGRQRMLTQKMSKESCIAASSYRKDTTLDDLAGTMRIFEASLNALRHGMANVGIMPPPNGTISSGLDVVLTDWSEVKPMLTQVRTGDVLEPEKDAFKFRQLNTTMVNMNKVVGLYVQAAKPAPAGS